MCYSQMTAAQKKELRNWVTEIVTAKLEDGDTERYNSDIKPFIHSITIAKTEEKGNDFLHYAVVKLNKEKPAKYRDMRFLDTYVLKKILDRLFYFCVTEADSEKKIGDMYWTIGDGDDGLAVHLYGNTFRIWLRPGDNPVYGEQA